MDAEADPRARLATLAANIAAGGVVPVLGPGLLTLTAVPDAVPAGARELSHRLAARAPVSGRIRNNLWHTAQYIETSRHRVTVDRLMAEIFAPVPPPSPLHEWLARHAAVPMIIDTWYDGTMAAALAGRADWGLVQGASKARRLAEAPWCRAYGPTGVECVPAATEAWTTLLYKPHGAAQPVGDVLVSDSDYVEVLTEIDIQTPIPPEVRRRRRGRSMLFLGCRFYDQILRNFARAFLKGAGPGRFAVVPLAELTRNEVTFLGAEGITPLDLPLAEAAGILTAG